MFILLLFTSLVVRDIFAPCIMESIYLSLTYICTFYQTWKILNLLENTHNYRSYIFRSSTILRELVQSLAKVTLLLKHSVKLRRCILCGDVAACLEMACVLSAQQTAHTTFTLTGHSNQHRSFTQIIYNSWTHYVQLAFFLPANEHPTSYEDIRYQTYGIRGCKIGVNVFPTISYADL
jgi:hypothetical protein